MIPYFGRYAKTMAAFASEGEPFAKIYEIKADGEF